MPTLSLYKTELIYTAIMDCDGDIKKLYGNSSDVRVRLTADFKAGFNHFSYEEQGILS